MKVDISILEPQHPVVEVLVSGQVDGLEMAALLMECVKVGRETGISLLLSDFTDASLRVSMPELARLVRLAVDLEPLPWRQAILTPSDRQSIVTVDTWALASNNRGFAVRTFAPEHRPQALAWLESLPDATT